MKFKATSSFRNTHKFKVTGRGKNDSHIEKGDEFEADMEDAKTAEVIAVLGHCGRIIDVENQPENGRKIDAEVVAEKVKHEEAKLSGKSAKKESV